MTCCARAGQNEDVRESLAARVRELLQSKADISASSQLRPFLWYWGFISRLHDQLQELARHSFNALSAGDPPTAGIEHTRMQSAFDGVATSVEELNARLERWRQIESASHFVVEHLFYVHQAQGHQGPDELYLRVELQIT